MHRLNIANVKFIILAIGEVRYDFGGICVKAHVCMQMKRQPRKSKKL